MKFRILLFTVVHWCKHFVSVFGEQDFLTKAVCDKSDDGYVIPDPEQCDRYIECAASGKRTIKLCTDGWALDLKTGKCDLGSKVDCTGRSKLQRPTGTGMCPRLNGNFALPASISCSEYVDCREGQPFQQSCGYGAVFDEILGCVHPDETNREGCTAEDVFGFKCPALTGDSLRFGDHDRVAHPTDCASFYACLATGKPRLLGCDNPKVFNPETGFCTEQHLVPGCENYYPPDQLKVDIEVEREKIAEEIRAELEAKYGLRLDGTESDLSKSSETKRKTERPKVHRRPDGFAGLGRKKAPSFSSARQKATEKSQATKSVNRQSTSSGRLGPLNSPTKEESRSSGSQQTIKKVRVKPASSSYPSEVRSAGIATYQQSQPSEQLSGRQIKYQGAKPSTTSQYQEAQNIRQPEPNAQYQEAQTIRQPDPNPQYSEAQTIRKLGPNSQYRPNQPIGQPTHNDQYKKADIVVQHRSNSQYQDANAPNVQYRVNSQYQEAPLQTKPNLQYQGIQPIVQQARPQVQTRPVSQYIEAQPAVQQRPNFQYLETQPNVQQRPNSQYLEAQPTVQQGPNSQYLEAQPVVQQRPNSHYIEAQPTGQQRPNSQYQNAQPGVQSRPSSQYQETQSIVQQRPIAQYQEAQPRLQTRPIPLYQEVRPKVQTRTSGQHTSAQPSLQATSSVIRPPSSPTRSPSNSRFIPTAGRSSSQQYPSQGHIQYEGHDTQQQSISVQSVIPNSVINKVNPPTSGHTVQVRKGFF